MCFQDDASPEEEPRLTSLGAPERDKITFRSAVQYLHDTNKAAMRIRNLVGRNNDIWFGSFLNNEPMSK
jgi:hypothetical protein